jgi:hypothetical protein
MSKITRRDFLKLAGSVAAAGVMGGAPYIARGAGQKVAPTIPRSRSR